MKKFIFLFVIALVTLSFNPYKNFFTSDYDRAIGIIKDNGYEFHFACSRLNISPKLVKSIVFPEIMRYNMFQNFLEESALELMYIDKGSSSVDFSIGYFQMKPSFVETLEKLIKSDTLLAAKYKTIPVYTQKTESFIRKERLNRLKQINWQIIYTCAFVDLMEVKFSEEELTEKNKVIYYASAYNFGINSTTEEIKKWSETKAFPYGTDYDGKQFSYAEISLHYYEIAK